MQKSKALAGLISCFLIISILLISYNTEKIRASGQDIYVDDDQRYPDEADGSLYNPFYSIQDALSAAKDGDTIKILPGTYSGDIFVDKSVTITTDDMENTLITSYQKSSYMIEIKADSVSLEDLHIQDFTTTSHRKAVIHISSNTAGVKIIDNFIEFSENGYGIQIDGPTTGSIIRNNTIFHTKGILIENSNSVIIQENRIDNCTGSYPALKLVTSDGNFIEDNSFENNIYGVYLHSSSHNYIFNNVVASNSITGIFLNGGTNNNIVENLILDNSNIGIDLGSSEGIIFGNTINGNYIGISISGSGYNISNNTISSSTYLGIYAKTGSHNNIIFNNDFLDKTESHARENGANYWNKDFIGNYWDDFYGPDPSNLHNIVTYDSMMVPDIYKYTYGGVTDNYPQGIYQKEPEISNPSPSNLAEGVDRTPILSVVVKDPEHEHFKERLDVYFYYIADGASNLIGARYNVESDDTASIAFSSTIQGKNAVYSYKGLGYGYIGVWYVEVEDSYSKTISPVWIFSTAEPPANNSKPIGHIGADEEYVYGDKIRAQINDSIRFDASGSYDPDGEIVFYRWSFGDGTAVINKESTSHSYKSEGQYNVNLAVIDDDGSSNSVNKTVIIESDYNLAPIAKTNGPYNGFVGQSIQFLSSGSRDPNAEDTVTYFWDFGDGSNSSEQNPFHTYSKANKYTVSLTLMDQFGEQHSDTTTATIKTKSDESPGFEIIIIIISTLFIFILLNKRKK